LCCLTVLPYCLFTVIVVAVSYSGQINDDDDDDDDANIMLRLEMHDEIFHFEIFKNFIEILKYFKTPFLK